MEHDYYGGLSMLLLWVLIVKNLGPGIAKSIDKEIDEYENGWSMGRENHKSGLLEEIDTEKLNQKRIENNLLIVAAQREAIAIQQEIEYRARFMQVYSEVLKRLNYQTKLAMVHKYYTQHNLIDWVKREVLKVITPDWNNKYVDDCINVLEKMPKVSSL